MSRISDFYDEFSSQQAAAGINNRHISIMHHLEMQGLRKSDRVLEVGCGIGTVSELILRFLSDYGHLHGVDISPVSIQIAQQRCKKYANSFFEARDLTSEVINKEFNVIVLPDVIEHIPIDLHPLLFKNLYQMLADDGLIFIHIPHPNYLNWLISNKKEQLQVIDQPIYTHNLLEVVYPIGFYLDFLKSYSVYSTDNDYQIIILRKLVGSGNYDLQGTYFQLSFFLRIRNQIRYVLRGFK